MLLTAAAEEYAHELVSKK
jgi:hypothetical protein